MWDPAAAAPYPAAAAAAAHISVASYHFATCESPADARALARLRLCSILLLLLDGFQLAHRLRENVLFLIKKKYSASLFVHAPVGWQRAQLSLSHLINMRGFATDGRLLTHLVCIPCSPLWRRGTWAGEARLNSVLLEETIHNLLFFGERGEKKGYVLRTRTSIIFYSVPVHIICMTFSKV